MSRKCVSCGYAIADHKLNLLKDGPPVFCPDRTEADIEKMEEDLHMLRYFWEEKEDVTCYSGWEEMQQNLEILHPEITDAVRRYDIAKRTLTRLLENF